MDIAETLKSVNDTQLKEFIAEVDFLMQNNSDANWQTTLLSQWITIKSGAKLTSLNTAQFNLIVVAVFREAALRWSVMLPPPTA